MPLVFQNIEFMVISITFKENAAGDIMKLYPREGGI